MRGALVLGAVALGTVTLVAPSVVMVIAGNPPDVTTPAIRRHPFGLHLAADDKRALVAFVRTL